MLRELEKPKPLTLEQIQQRDSEWYGRSEWEIRTEMERRISKRLNKRKKAA